VILTQPELDLSLLDGMTIYEPPPPPAEPLPPPPPVNPPPEKGKSLFTSLRTLATSFQTELETRITGPKVEQRPVERLYICEFSSAGEIGIELAVSSSGLCVGGIFGEAEAGGTVEVGDGIHTVNGASIHLLHPNVAKVCAGSFPHQQWLGKRGD